MSQKIVTLIIDDHAVVREGVRRALELRDNFEIHQAATKQEALAQIARTNPTLLIVDINLPDGSGLEIVQWVRSISRTMAIIVLSLHSEDEVLLASMRSGASAFVNKEAPLPDLLASIDHALQSPGTFSALDLVGALSRSSQTFGLSPRELQILSTLHRGQPLRLLAQSFFISESTLKTHLSAIYRKMDVKSRIQAVEKARKAGLS